MYAFTVLTRLVLLQLVTCVLSQTRTNSHLGALKWKRPQAQYLSYIIYTPGHKQHRTDAQT